ncbi:heavy metal translocating P-type ATPase [Muriicola sp. Z0-33]|uniref:heavy metal translocating P-type ATPase n=1 Tax=Muriicola sp. Z0-33 TaxID=2816957 RepID=UPI002239058E|nr:heavy metal translocating P-type ATPase metal-binding domain-containing protein [Muriicola sp. Z0-33]MCW5517196.1 heavy metal translocating P-type ATPase metal-binding domain-containing protein [Muriicola sp. Z0-33]
MDPASCYHCGEPCNRTHIVLDDKDFCCNGCKTVFEIFHQNDLSYYYELQESPGSTPDNTDGKFDFLDTPEFVESLLSFHNEKMEIVDLFIPNIHCSSCIWILENLNKLHDGVSSSQVDFPRKTISITYNTDKIVLKELVMLLSKIGYEPNISLNDYKNAPIKKDRSLWYKTGIAGFAFGNIMFLSFPEYFEVGEFWLEQFKGVFRWLMLVFSLPVVFYSGRDYFISAFKGIRAKLLSIDVPIALGITVLFLRSATEVVLDLGPGFFDSLTGLIFFLLLGKVFQQKTYSFLSFERDYKSYFPIAATRIDADRNEESVQVYKINKGDRLLIRNEELIPADGILISTSAKVDYSFVTGEAKPVRIVSGDKVFSGGKQISGPIEIEVLKTVSQSYLTQLWSRAAFQKDRTSEFRTLTDSIGKRFTITILIIAVVAASFWMVYDSSKALNVFTAVLIIACPCAIALAAPFTLGNMLRIYGRCKFYLKDTQSIERLSRINTVIFDKTGTITTTKINDISYNGLQLTPDEESLLKNTLRGSNHPLSRSLYELLKEHEITTLDDYREHPGKGLEASKDERNIRIGSADFVGNTAHSDTSNTAVHISSDNNYKGYYSFQNAYREGVSDVARALGKTMDIAVLSGDNDGERRQLEKLFPKLTHFYFNQKPEDKLRFIQQLQEQNKNVLMVGDGLNDAGAFAQSDVGIAVSEDINVFSPASDGILDGLKFKQLYAFILASKSAMKIIKVSFVLSLLYNVVGLYFAVSAQLEPVIAAILMPLSSISIVIFTTVATNFLGRNLK